MVVDFYNRFVYHVPVPLHLQYIYISINIYSFKCTVSLYLSLSIWTTTKRHTEPVSLFAHRLNILKFKKKQRILRLFCIPFNVVCGCDSPCGVLCKYRPPARGFQAVGGCPEVPGRSCRQTTS